MSRWILMLLLAANVAATPIPEATSSNLAPPEKNTGGTANDQRSATKPQNQANQAPPSINVFISHELDGDSASGHSSGKKEKNDWWNFSLTDALIALFTAVSAGAAGLAIWRSERTAHSTERAAIFIIVDGDNMAATIGHNAGYHHSSEMPNEWAPRVSYRFKNYGRSPALIKEISAKMEFLYEPPSSLSHEQVALDRRDHVVAVGEETRERDCNLRPAFSRTGDSLAVWYGYMKIYFFGRVVYEDIFGDRHEHRFFWCYDGRTFGPDYVKGYNKNT